MDRDGVSTGGPTTAFETPSRKPDQVIDIGEQVICDICSADWTGEEKSGGFLLQSKGVCPDCAPRLMRRLEKYKETEYIRALCPPDMSFAEFCLAVRGGDNTIKIWTRGEDNND